ncbi:hypothetical protein HDV05_006734, partial [Chytridiales sp. JEL 0842]
MHYFHSLSTSFLAILLTLSAATLAFPNGAPRCQINPAFILTGHRIQQTAAQLGAKITLNPPTYTPGGPPIEVTIESRGNFAGILAYANLPTDNLTHVGSFDLANAQGAAGQRIPLKPQPADECALRQVKQESLQATFTHSVPMINGGRMVLHWQPPRTNMGPLQFSAVIAVGAPIQPWAVLDPVTIQPSGAPAPSTSGGGVPGPLPSGGGAPSSTGQTAPAPSSTTAPTRPRLPLPGQGQSPPASSSAASPAPTGPSSSAPAPAPSSRQQPLPTGSIPQGPIGGPVQPGGGVAAVEAVVTVIAPPNIRVVMMQPNGAIR